MLEEKKLSFSLYVNRVTGQWIVRDAEGHFWVVPSSENAWEQRQHYQLADNVDLEPIPGHYHYLLNLPC